MRTWGNGDFDLRMGGGEAGEGVFEEEARVSHRQMNSCAAGSGEIDSGVYFMPRELPAQSQ